MVTMPQYHVGVERTDDNRYIASNSHGAQLELTGTGEGPLFSPVDLLLVLRLCRFTACVTPQAATD